MKRKTTLFLGAAVVICAGIPSLAQDGFKAAPAVAPAPQQAAFTAAPSAENNAPPTTDMPVPQTAPAPQAASAQKKTAKKPAAVTQDAKEDAKEPAKADVQEATNHDAGPATQIDAASTKDNPDDSDSIAATVNDESISDYEIRQRMALYMATAGITQQLNDEQKKRIRGQILEQLEAEKLQLQEAVKKKITVSPVEVDKYINNMLTSQHINIQQLRASLTGAGASEEALRAQITASIAWQKAVQDEYGDRVDVTQDMVNSEMQRYAESANKTHYHLMEIFLPVDNPEQNAKVKKDADEIETQLHQGAPFPMVARQFSQHPTAATGGDIGWVSDGQLAPELNDAVAKLELGGISPPIRSTGGWYIMAVRERQEAMGTKIAPVATGSTGPAGTLPLGRLLFPAPRGTPKVQMDEIVKVAGQIHDHYSGCEMLDKIHDQMKGTVYMNLGDAKMSDLSPQIQAAMKDTHPGDAGVPFQDDAGVEVIGRCDKRVQVQTAYVMPSRNQVEDQLFQSQISVLARRYLRDLKRDANIQVRDNSKPDALIR